MEGVLTGEVMKSWGLHERGETDVLVYSMGSIDEGHGAALQRDNDDIVAKRTAVLACERLGIQYRGHLPFGSDRVGEIARDWCPAWTEPEEALSGIVDYIKNDIGKWPKKVSHVAIISGHGGNNFLKDEEERISQETGVPAYYVCPFEECKTTHEVYGEIEVEHANSGEHSVAAYMGVLDNEALGEINRVAKEDPKKALELWKPLCGLGWYVLFGGPRYEPLRNPDWGLADHANRFMKEKHILGDYAVGKALFEQNLDNTIRQIRDFTEKP